MIHFVTPLKRTVSSRSFISSGRDSYSSKYEGKCMGESRRGVVLAKEEHRPPGSHFNENL